MLFKILQGNKANLPITLTDGYCYYLRDEHYFYVDHKDPNGTLVRSKLSAEYADKLRYVNGGTMIEISPEDLALKSEVAVKADASTVTSHIGNTTVHITADERTSWNSLQGQIDDITESALHKIELTQAEYDALPEKDPSVIYIITDGTDDFDAHIVDNVIHITSAERTAWNAKGDVTTDDNAPIPTDPITGSFDGHPISDFVLKSELDLSVVDNLTTADSTKSLSANQGKVLSERIAGLAEEMVTRDTAVANEKLSLSGGTMEGVLTAKSNTQYTTKQVRNIFLSTADPTDADGENGDIWLKYEA